MFTFICVKFLRIVTMLFSVKFQVGFGAWISIYGQPKVSFTNRLYVMKIISTEFLCGNVSNMPVLVKIHETPLAVRHMIAVVHLAKCCVSLH